MASSESTQRYVIISCDMCVHPFGLVGLHETTVYIYIYIYTCCTPSHQIALHHLALCMLSCCFQYFLSLTAENMCIYIYMYQHIYQHIRFACAKNMLKTRMHLMRHKMPVTPAGFHLNSHSHSLLPPFHRFPGKSFGFFWSEIIRPFGGQPTHHP